MNDPILRIREYQRDRVNFVLENVDLAYATLFYTLSMSHNFKVCKLFTESHDGRPTDCWWVPEPNCIRYTHCLTFSHRHRWNRGQYNCPTRWIHRPSSRHGSAGQFKLWCSDAVYKSLFIPLFYSPCWYIVHRTAIVLKTVLSVQSSWSWMLNVTTRTRWTLPVIILK